MYFCWNRGVGGKLTPSKREEIINSRNSKRDENIVVAHKLDEQQAQVPLHYLAIVYPPPKEKLDDKITL